MVFFCHAQTYIPRINWPLLALTGYCGQGWIGVDLFFVLSGFLITGLLLDSRDAYNYFSGFYARRVLRIFPLYYLVLTGIVALSSFLTRTNAQHARDLALLVPLPEDRWLFFSYLTNWIGLWKTQWVTGTESIVAHFWSLAVEEQFYFVWPFIVWLVRPRAIPWIAAIVASLSAIIRLAWVVHTGVQIVPPQSIEIQLATICRLDGLFIGALCACFFRDKDLMTRIHPWLKWIAASALGLCFAVFSGMLFFPLRAGLFIYGTHRAVPHSLQDAARLFALCGGFTVLAAGFGALVLLAVYTETNNTLMQKILRSRLLAPIGIYSYGIYVFHVPIMGLVAVYASPRIFGGVSSPEETLFTGCAYVAVLAGVTFIIAALSHEFFEKPILRLKRYFEPKYAVRDSRTPEEQASVPQPTASVA